MYLSTKKYKNYNSKTKITQPFGRGHRSYKSATPSQGAHQHSNLQVFELIFLKECSYPFVLGDREPACGLIRDDSILGELLRQSELKHAPACFYKKKARTFRLMFHVRIT